MLKICVEYKENYRNRGKSDSLMAATAVCLVEELLANSVGSDFDHFQAPQLVRCIATAIISALTEVCASGRCEYQSNAALLLFESLNLAHTNIQLGQNLVLCIGSSGRT